MILHHVWIFLAWKYIDYFLYTLKSSKLNTERPLKKSASYICHLSMLLGHIFYCTCWQCPSFNTI